MSVLSLKKITRIYEQGGKSLSVLNSVDLDIKEGESVALVGPSGSGKTTLLQIAGLLDTPTSGEVIINGEAMSYSSPIRGEARRGANLGQLSKNAPTLTLPLMERDYEQQRTSARRNHIGFVYQFHCLLPEFSALENVMLPQMIAGVASTKAKEKSETLLRSVGLQDRMSHRPAKLSGGEQQRVAIARAIANNPALLLADEPTGNLDPQTAAHVFDMLMALVREHKISALIATHNLELAKRMDRVLRLDNGALKL